MLHGVSPHGTLPRQRTLRLLEPRMHSLETMKSLLELRGQPIICLGQVCEQCVTTARGTVKQVQKGGTGWLALVGDVRMPRHGVCVFVQEGLQKGIVVCAAMDEVDFREALGGTGGRVDVVTAKVAAKLQGFINGETCKVLVTEGCIMGSTVSLVFLLDRI